MWNVPLCHTRQFCSADVLHTPVLMERGTAKEKQMKSGGVRGYVPLPAFLDVEYEDEKCLAGWGLMHGLQPNGSAGAWLGVPGTMRLASAGWGGVDVLCCQGSCWRRCLQESRTLRSLLTAPTGHY